MIWEVFSVKYKQTLSTVRCWRADWRESRGFERTTDWIIAYTVIHSYKIASSSPWVTCSCRCATRKIRRQQSPSYTITTGSANLSSVSHSILVTLFQVSSIWLHICVQKHSKEKQFQNGMFKLKTFPINYFGWTPFSSKLKFLWLKEYCYVWNFNVIIFSILT